MGLASGALRDHFIGAARLYDVYRPWCRGVICMKVLRLTLDSIHSRVSRNLKFELDFVCLVYECPLSVAKNSRLRNAMTVYF